MRRLAVALAVALAIIALRPAAARACVRASEANTLLGWSTDGGYALLALVDEHGVMDHAEILPTRYQGFVYVIVPQDDQIVVTRVKVGTCADFGDEAGAIVERKRGTLTDATLRALRTVKSMKFVADAAATKATTATATFTGAKRYAVHDLQLHDGAATLTLPVPVWCVGSCMADERWTSWKAAVTAVHTAPSGDLLYEVRLDGVCNAGTLIRLVAATPAKRKAPKHRCTGSGG